MAVQNVYVTEGTSVEFSKILAMKITGYSEWLSEPGDAFIGDNVVKFTADLINGGDNTNLLELRYQSGKQITTAAFNVIIIENTQPAPIYGKAKAETMLGTELNDTLCGNGGNDTLSGGIGNDTIDGGSGNDRIAGGVGNDTLSGSVGKDTFVFETGNGGDIITDFEVLVDKISYNGTTIAWLDLRGMSTDTANGALLDLDGVAGNDVLLQGFHFDT